MQGIRNTITDPNLNQGEGQYTKGKGVDKWTGKTYDRRNADRRTQPEVVLSLTLEDAKALQSLTRYALADVGGFSTPVERTAAAYLDLQVALAERR